MKKIIGSNICELPKQQGLIQDALAKFLSVSRVQISHYERGERNISMAHLNKLADLFGVELSDLLEENLDAQKLNLAFALRSNNNETDLVNIASFKKVVYFWIKIVVPNWVGIYMPQSFETDMGSQILMPSD